MEEDSGDGHGAFMEKFFLLPPPPPPSSDQQQLPLHGLTFAIKDIFDVAGRITGFGTPDWYRTHASAIATAPAVLAAGATGVGKTVMDEMAYSINGENAHYGTPANPCAPGRVPGSSSSGSASLADFALGWFARDLATLSRVTDLLLPPVSADAVDAELRRPSRAIIPADCFKILGASGDDHTLEILNASVAKIFGSDAVDNSNLGEFVSSNVPSIGKFMTNGSSASSSCVPTLSAISHVMRVLQRSEFKAIHAEWVDTVKPNLSPGIRERVHEPIASEDEPAMRDLHAVRTKFKSALAALLKEDGILAIPTVPGTPPKLRMEAALLEDFQARAFSLLSIAGLSGFCQVSIPLGTLGSVPVSVSLLAQHGADRFLVAVAQELHEALRDEATVAWGSSV